MRNIITNISTLGIQIIRQGISLIVRGEACRSLCAYSSLALRWTASAFFTGTHVVKWHVLGGDPAMRMACCCSLLTAGRLCFLATPDPVQRWRMLPVTRLCWCTRSSPSLLLLWMQTLFC